MLNKKNKSLFIIFGITASVVILGILAFIYLRMTPQYSLLQIRKAAQQRDYALFEKYVDVNSVVENVFADAMKNTDTENVGMFGELLSGLVDSTKNAVKVEFRTSIENGESSNSLYSDMSFINLLTKLEIEKHGKTADIVFKVDDSEFNASMRNEKGTWRIFKINNLESFNKEEEAEKSVNIIEKALNEEVTLATITMKVNSVEKLSELPSGFGESTKPSDGNNIFLKLNLTIKNISEEDVTVVEDMIVIADSQDNQYEMQSLYFINDENQLYYESIRPNLAKTGNVYFEVPKSSEGYYLPISHKDTGDMYKILFGI